MKLMGESDEVETEELRVGGEREGVRDGARCLWGRLEYEEKEAVEA